MDLHDSGYYGISIDKAYAFIKAKKLKGKPVIVAIIDSGVDTTHEDLKGILWHNPKEILATGSTMIRTVMSTISMVGIFWVAAMAAMLNRIHTKAHRVYHRLKAKYDGKDPSTIKSYQRRRS